jgi:hypothetical protein
MTDFLSNVVRNSCCDFWSNGCGLNGAFGACATGLDSINPIVEGLSDLIWCLGSPLAFPFIFCFSPDPHTFETSGYEISMMGSPLRRPCTCLLSTVFVPCAQWFARRKVLGGDMTKYKLWQGYHDGPHCCARYCNGAPITIQSGTYGEQDCPNFFLCLEVTCLAGFWSTCCSFDVTRRYQREERGLQLDPTEARHRRCIGFFSQIMHQCMMLGCCCCMTSCCLAICAPDSPGAQECSGEAGQAAHACCRIASTIWRGIIWTKVIGMGCMTAQIIHEADTPWDGRPKGRHPGSAPTNNKMNDRGFDEEGNAVEMNDMKMPWEKGTAGRR